MTNVQINAIKKIASANKGMTCGQVAMPDGRFLVTDSYRVAVFPEQVEGLEVIPSYLMSGVVSLVSDYIKKYGRLERIEYPLPSAQRLREIKKEIKEDLKKSGYSNAKDVPPSVLVVTDKTDDPCRVFTGFQLDYLMNFQRIFAKEDTLVSAVKVNDKDRHYTLFFENKYDNMIGFILGVNTKYEDHHDSKWIYDYWVRKSLWDGKYEEIDKKKEEEPIKVFVNPCLQDKDLRDQLENQGKEDKDHKEDDIMTRVITKPVEEVEVPAVSEEVKPAGNTTVSIEGSEKGLKESKISKISQQLEEGVSKVYESGNYMQYLNLEAGFYKYSYRNTVLIYTQCPNATKVCGYKGWAKFDRHVKKGAKAIQILAPVTYKVKKDDVSNEGFEDKEDDNDTVTSKVFFRPVSVFDISQTAPNNGDKYDEEFDYQVLRDSVEDFDDMVHALEDVAGIPVSFMDIPEHKCGAFYNVKENYIVVQEGLPETETVVSLIHEIAHSKMHPAGCQLDRQTKEVQAESVAYVVCKYFGIETGSTSFDYVASWAQGKDKKVLKNNLNVIQKTASALIDAIEKKLSKKENSKRAS